MIVYRSKKEDIMFEYLPAEDGQADKVIILLPGMPSVPKQKQIMSWLSKQGWDVVFPRYKGTWESDGQFLQQSPVEDIADLLKALRQESFAEFYAGESFDISAKDFYIVGSSFGGSVALCLNEHQEVSKVTALSPVVDFESHDSQGGEEDFEHLKEFVNLGFKNCYRFDESDWQSMQQGKLFNPPQQIDSKLSDSILICYGLQDELIDYQQIEDYIQQNNLQSIKLEAEGHLSLSSLPEDVWMQILRFFN